MSATKEHEKELLMCNFNFLGSFKCMTFFSITKRAPLSWSSTQRRRQETRQKTILHFCLYFRYLHISTFIYICCFATVFYPSFLVIIIYVCFPLREYPHTHTVHNKKDSEKGNFWAEFDYKNGQYGMIRYDLSFTTTSNLGVLLKIIL